MRDKETKRETKELMENGPLSWCRLWLVERFLWKANVPKVQENEGWWPEFIAVKESFHEQITWCKPCNAHACYPSWAAQDPPDLLQGESMQSPCSVKRPDALAWVPYQHSMAKFLIDKLACVSKKLYMLRRLPSPSESHLPLPPQCWDRRFMTLYLTWANCYCESISNCLEQFVKMFT